MGILGWVVGAGVVHAAVKQYKKANKEYAEMVEADNRRKYTPCHFEDGFTKDEFEMMVKRAAKKIRRISKITIDGPFVTGTAQSQSGISEWEFTLDFNNYGHITGRYWVSSDNKDSNIPDRLGDLISSAVKNYSPDKYNKGASDTGSKHALCPSCGKQLTTDDAIFCAYCGTRIR